MEEVLDLAHRVLDRIAQPGDQMEAYVEHKVVTTVQAGTGGSVRRVGRADTRGIGVRVVVGADHVGYASTADVSDAGLDTVIAKARANATVSDADPAGAELPAPSAEYVALDGLRLESLVTMPVVDKVALVSDLARRATSLDPRIRRIDTAEWRDDHRRVAVCSTNGVAATFETAFAELWCDAIGADDHGDASDFGYWWGRDPGEVDVEELAATAVRRTVRLLGSVAALPPVDAAVLDPAVTSVFVAAVGRALTGGALGNGRSPFAGRHGEQVVAEHIGLVDDGLCTNAPGGAPFDDEGVPRRRTQLIDAGVLRGTLHSSATAAFNRGAHSTGNARRVSHKAAPRAAPTTLRVEDHADPPPTSDRDRDGIYVQQLSGSGTGVSSVTGRVSLGGIGYVMRDGEPAGRLPTLPIVTTLQAFLRQLVGVCNDAQVVPELPVMAPRVLWRLKDR
jgi:PmbA protein